MYFIGPLFWLISIAIITFLTTRKSKLTVYHRLWIVGVCFVFQFIFLLYIAYGWNDSIYEKYGYDSPEANGFDMFMVFGTPLLWAFLLSLIFRLFYKLYKK
jgi:hypothetical protein